MAIHRPIWSLTPQEVYETLKTSAQGLSETEAMSRLKEQGFNELPEPPQRSLILRFIDQLIHFMALLLWVAGILAFISHTPQLGWAIWAVIWINAIFSFVQEYQAERALTALKKVLPSQVKVYRNGTLHTINARELVPGDVMQLEEGDRISADARLVSVESLYVDVSVLTGESLPITRHSEPILSEKLRPADVPNLVLTGSTVASGRGMAVVYATASRTEFGHVAHLTTQVKRETSTLEVQITRIVRMITALAISMGTLVFLLTHWLVGMETKESFIFAIGIIVAFVPEGLLPTVTLSLAMGVQRMAHRQALVRRLSAVESLSATTVICTDKTGTLTKNEMTVRAVWTSGQSLEVTGVGYEPTGEVKIPSHLTAKWQVNLLLAGAAFCSNARLIHPAGPSYWQEIGDPTEAALLVAALKGGLNLEELHQQAQRLREIPFDSRRRLMTVVLDWQLSELWPNEFPYLSFSKGSPLEVINRCPHLLKDGQLLPMNEGQKSEICTANDDLARQGYRVLGVAARKGGEDLLTEDAQELEQNLIFLGLVAMFDPPRPEVSEAIAACHGAGIQVTMVTGDYGLTAEAIARRIGLITGKVKIVTGEALGHLSDAQLRQILHYRNGLIFARMMPEQKLRLVQAYKDLGHVVAVTGDGVNDAPALRAANIGIAMGLNGTDVAREAADIVLLDDNFATIVSAVEQGRAVYQNIRKFMTYILSSNMAEIVPFFAMVALKIPPALVVLQILAIDLGTDMIPALALGAELPETGIMEHPPRSPKQSLLNAGLLGRAYGFLGLMEAIIGMTGFFVVWWSHGYELRELQAISPTLLSHSADAATIALYAQATTVTLAAIVACQDGNVFACRSERVSIFKLGFFTNRLIWVGIAIEWLLIFSIIYISPLQKIFSTAPLLPWQWLMLLICPIILLGVEELRKKAFSTFLMSKKSS
ncbi:cation-transporting ATPase, E1-E2 type [Crocosphaera subtropica ATCC 51142]|uniref:Cation-transporting ATPase, E1-E2 type n=1 Tax=Crocosphaera subtropica (strain ATCC 51142 / BH68) TaxID=43989 RepID=B1WPR5_CROS5|nr:cation-transporting P-type ATPase [Crocosphaera subtropica]ACB51635.1 cation-transporting ATPase, E1-E2 type [Crocosphaera subtropica ATCC 51142]